MPLDPVLRSGVRSRVVASVLSLSAAGLIALVSYEGYTDRAVIPVQGDVPTVGFGTTTRDDGTPVQLGDTTTPQRALRAIARDASEAESAVQQCANVPMYQHEYDVWVSFAYNVGGSAFCRSTAARLLREGDYSGACDQLLRWVYVKGAVINGLVKRREDERRRCLGE